MHRKHITNDVNRSFICSPKYFTWNLKIFLLLLIAPISYAQISVTFGIAIEKEAKLYFALNDIYEEAFSKTNIKYRSISCTPSNCAKLSMSGIIQGEAVRHADYGKLYPHLEKIDSEIFDITTISITRKNQKPIHSINALLHTNHKVSYQLGYRMYEKKLTKILPLNQIYPSSGWKSSINEVLNGKTDIHIAVEQLTYPEMDEAIFSKVNVQRLDGYIVKTYPYVRKDFKHKTDLRRSLNNMKSSKRIQQIFKSYGIPLY